MVMDPFQIGDQDVGPELTEADKAELDRRIADLENDPGKAIPWEDVQTYLRRPR
jgi:putative addiction module component (TIGR02574 family)